jgi:hypothetical protein
MTVKDHGTQRFLFGEMTIEEHEQFEERLLSDEEFFYEVASLEDELVDRYVLGKLQVEELHKFEMSLDRIPSRRVKTANAAALRQLIREDAKDERTITIAEQNGIWERLFSGFGFGSMTLGYASAGLMLVLLGGLGWALYQNAGKDAEIARITGDLHGTERYAELERRLSDSRSRESELQSEIDAVRDVTGDLTADLEAERKRRTELEREIAAVRSSRPDLPKPSPRKTERPNVGAITLTPGRDDQIASYEPLQSVKRISVVIQLPADISVGERLSVRLNGREIVREVAVRTNTVGSKSLLVTVPSDLLKPGSNLITAHDRSGEKISEYTLTANKDQE